MKSGTTTGSDPRATTEGPLSNTSYGHASAECAYCDQPATGYDAARGQSVCSACARSRGFPRDWCPECGRNTRHYCGIRRLTCLRCTFERTVITDGGRPTGLVTLVEQILGRIDAARESADVAADYDDRNARRYNEGRMAAYVDVLWMLGADTEVEA